MAEKRVVDMSLKEIKAMCGKRPDCSKKCPAWIDKGVGGRCEFILSPRNWNLMLLQRKGYV